MFKIKDEKKNIVKSAVSITGEKTWYPLTWFKDLASVYLSCLEYFWHKVAAGPLSER